jgi:hypothetical protein
MVIAHHLRGPGVAISKLKRNASPDACSDLLLAIAKAGTACRPFEENFKWNFYCT